MRKKGVSYPLPPRTAPPWNPGPLHRIELAYQYHFRKKRPVARNSLQLRPVKGAPAPLTREDMPLVFLSHNERRFMPSFFAHYRMMGVTRFICVDDRSTDGSFEYVMAQEDADVFVSNVRYREAARGKIWREKLFDLYGHDRWYLNVDSDEFLVFESFGKESAWSFSRRLQERGILRYPATMIDLYPATRLRAAVFDGRDETMPWEVATHFDGVGYRLSLDNKGIRIRGGVRWRVFGVDVELIKYPLIHWDHRCSLGTSIHRPLPGIFNFAPVMGCLLHFKFFSDFRQRTQTAVRGGQHLNNAEVYRQIKHCLENDSNDGICFACEDSLAYGGPEDLIERGFALPLAS
ncbi:MAG: glycosyltransferase family 2 protein [Pirellulales bacterium]|nr:glycosyltransferase family 2 protein [Pirellulales bacterium]